MDDTREHALVISSASNVPRPLLLESSGTGQTMAFFLFIFLYSLHSMPYPCELQKEAMNTFVIMTISDSIIFSRAHALLLSKYQVKYILSM